MRLSPFGCSTIVGPAESASPVMPASRFMGGSRFAEGLGRVPLPFIWMFAAPGTPTGAPYGLPCGGGAAYGAGYMELPVGGGAEVIWLADSRCAARDGGMSGG